MDILYKKFYTKNHFKIWLIDHKKTEVRQRGQEHEICMGH